MTINPHPVAHVEQNGARSLPIGYIQMENTFNQNTIQRQDVQPRPMISISKGVSINGNGISITNPSRQFHPNFYPQDSPASAT